MAIPVASVIVKIIKTAMKRAATKELVAGSNKATILKNMSMGNITDTQAILFNRLKSKLTADVKNILMRELGLNSNELNSLLKAYNQTAAMKKAGLGHDFKRIAVKQLGPAFDIKRSDSIAKIIETLSGQDVATGADRGGNSNTYVYALLLQLQKELDEKVMGALENNYGTKGGAKQTYIDVSVVQYFNSDKDYTDKHAYNLEQVLSTMSKDIEYYTLGSQQDIYILSNDGDWDVHAKAAVNTYVSNVKLDVKTIMRSRG